MMTRSQQRAVLPPDNEFVISNEVFEMDDGLDFPITSSGRTIENIIEDQMQSGNLTPPRSRSSSMISGPGTLPTHPTHESGQQQQQQQQQPPSAGVPAITVTASNPLRIPTSSPQKSAARAIPQAPLSGGNNNNYSPSHPGSHDSSGSSFLSGILNPKASTATFGGGNNNAQQLSHTPPNVFGTSYENKHFGKRQRSGSVSGRLRSASDLEERGLIDRSQKGILKDLIICGDDDLMKALDQYEKGNTADLENMIKSGALQNKAVPDLDLLGDLDLDFLTVNDNIDVGHDEANNGPGMYTLNQQQQDHLGSASVTIPMAQNRDSRSNSKSMPLPSLSGDNSQHASAGKKYPPNADVLASPVHDDGIGELDFTGDFSGTGDGYYGHSSAGASQPPSHGDQGSLGKGQRAFSPNFSEDARLRSNSLFSALITEPRTRGESQDLQYGGWMDRVVPGGNNKSTSNSVMQADVHHGAIGIPCDDVGRTSPPLVAVSQPVPIPKANTTSDDGKELTLPSTTTSGRRKVGRRKSDSAAIMDRKLKAKLKQELAEQKRREKQEKREQREREKQEKREARLAAKEEKQKLKEQKKKAASTSASAMQVEEEEKYVHVPGSGRPRSLSDPNFQSKRDEFGLMEVERPDGWVGAYSPESRRVRIEKFLAKRHQRVWTKTVKYDVRKNFADSRLRVKGRFVKKEDEMLMRDLMSMT